MDRADLNLLAASNLLLAIKDLGTQTDLLHARTESDHPALGALPALGSHKLAPAQRNLGRIETAGNKSICIQLSTPV